MKSLVALALAVLPAGAVASQPSAAVAPQSPQAAVESLLAADRAFAAASAGTDLVTALSAMFDRDVVMPIPGPAGFARGREAAVAVLRANSSNVTARAEWAPIRGGVSADGQHGFTLGFMTIRQQDGTVRPAKYLAYWVRRPEGWRAAVYKRMPRPDGEVSTVMMPPAVPSRTVAPTSDPALLRLHAQSLDLAERSFSDEAQRIGVGPAFQRWGSVDATNAGNGPGFTVGAEEIGRDQGGPPATVNWAPEGVLVASSGDLGVTWGWIRSNGPPPEGRPAQVPFFTIWRRPSPDSPWRYVAE
ncbi:MAG TPA: hypothetical protein VF577_03585 [Allosphingosinicella sp.]|jgi:ketosteroid isomerase-like protein